ncbi:FAD dependent oxidoreductase [Abortiporus biennis]|nr:FAD dependent oxidoreductase [Abortiporus biennis]
MAVDTSSKILIVGAGCFGLSTAYHLLKRGFTSITILDRSSVLPAPDAASTDINKIVRSSYPDLFYSRLAREAIEAWKDTSEWGDTYHESGVLVLGTGEAAYTDEAYINDVALGARIEKFSSPDAIRTLFSGDIELGSFDGRTGYLNKDGGWAFAAQGVSRLQSKVEALGGKVIPGKAVTSLLQKDGKTSGVKCADGSEYEAELVVLASGSWTASTFTTLDLKKTCLATGQSVAFIQLTPEEAKLYSNVPVYLDFESGFYMFPPNQDNIMKMSIHHSGHTWTSSTSSISTPRTKLSDGEDGLRVPKERIQAFRKHLQEVFPGLAKKPFSGTRLCWYTDSPDDDWIIGYHPTDSGIVFATAGSGHAYKFLPNIGKLVADAIQGTLEPELVKKFALNREPNASIPHSRPGQQPQELKLDELSTPADLLP